MDRMNMDENVNVAVVGIGRLGLCWALSLKRAGYDVIGIDNRESYVQSLRDGTFRTDEPGVDYTGLEVTTDLSEAARAGVIYVLVATPGPNYDTSAVARVLAGLNDLRLKDTHIVVGCTVLPEYCERVATALIPDCENCTISYNPEFIAQGRILHDQAHADLVLIGEGSRAAGDAISAHHRRISPAAKIRRMPTTAAEICKLSVNCFCTMKISFANMIGDISEHADVVLEAVGCDSRVGSKYLRAGYGYGGPCFPRDNRALAGYAETVGVDAMMSRAADDYNRYHTERQALHTDMTTFRGVAYKPDCPVPIIEESAKLRVAELVARRGVEVTIEDRASVVRAVREKYGTLFKYVDTSHTG